MKSVVVLVGNPNSGKTTLFNALTGMSARVGNYPGITVEHREGDVVLDGRAVRLIDLPGTYSMVPRADDEVVAVQGALGRLPLSGGAARVPDLVVAVVDATQLERNLYLVAQLRELRLPMVVALTMTDTIAKDGATIDVDALARRLGVPVVATAAAQKGGADALKRALGGVIPPTDAAARLGVPSAKAAEPLPLPPGVVVDADVRALGDAVAADVVVPATPEALAVWAIACAKAGTLSSMGLDPRVAARAAEAATSDRDALVDAVVRARWERAASWAQGVVTTTRADEAPSVRFTRRVDAVLLHPIAGPVALVGVFFTLFQALFSWSEPAMDAIEGVVSALRDAAQATLPADLPLLRSLVADGVIAGVGNVVVFVPQIAVLFFFLGVLEDSGYLARAAFLLDRLMARVGLHGRAFVPMLSGFACAVPAIMATRTIENRSDRIVTILVTPLVSCSARLPVYALMIATVFATMPPLLGVFSPGAVVMIAMYSLSVFAAVAMAAVFKRTLLKSPTPPLVLELPPYRVPKLSAVTKHAASRVRVFLTEAGTVILAITVVLWALFTFPRMEPDPSWSEQRAAQEQLAQSVAGRMGHALEPFVAPLGFDWKIGVGLVASFAAREVLVSTLGLVYGLGDAEDEESEPLRDALKADVDPATGKPVYTPLTGLSLMVFFVLAMQCMSTLAATKRETRSWRWPAFQLGYMTALAYVASLLVFQIGKALGFA